MIRIATRLARPALAAATAAAAIGLGIAAHAQTRPAAGPATRPVRGAVPINPFTGEINQQTKQGATTNPAGATGNASATKPAGAATKPALVVAPATPSPADAAKIDAAVKKLSSDAWKDRQAAQDELVTFGELAIGRLQELTAKAEDEEIRTRAGAALRQIEENASVGGSVITIKVKDASPKQVFELLGKQARAEFPTYPRNLFDQGQAGGARRMGFGGGVPNAISMDLERVNFWTAFKEACQKSGVFPQQMGNDRRMTLQQGSSSYWNGPSVVSGPFLIVANRLDHSRSVDLANPGNVQNNFSMQLAAFVEPKVKVVQSSYQVQVIECVDDKGNSLATTDRVYDSMSSGQQWMWNLSARLNYPAQNPGKKITRFRGACKFLVQTKSEALDVSDILTVKNKTFNIAGRRILIKECKKQGSEQFDVQMTIYRDGLGQAEWQMLSYPGYAIRLLDKDGKSLSSQGWGGGGSNNEMNYNWNFSKNAWGGDEKPGDPYRLVWEIPLETREMNVEFQFKDLPLPWG